MRTVHKCFNCGKGDLIAVTPTEDLTQEEEVKVVCSKCGAIFFVKIK